MELRNVVAEKGKDPFDFEVIREDFTRSVDKAVFVDKHTLLWQADSLPLN